MVAEVEEVEEAVEQPLQVGMARHIPTLLDTELACSDEVRNADRDRFSMHLDRVCLHINRFGLHIDYHRLCMHLYNYRVSFLHTPTPQSSNSETSKDPQN